VYACVEVLESYDRSGLGNMNLAWTFEEREVCVQFLNVTFQTIDAAYIAGFPRRSTLALHSLAPGQVTVELFHADDVAWFYERGASAVVHAEYPHDGCPPRYRVHVESAFGSRGRCEDSQHETLDPCCLRQNFGKMEYVFT
jgi:hypothetical protein